MATIESTLREPSNIFPSRTKRNVPVQTKDAEANIQDIDPKSVLAIGLSKFLNDEGKTLEDELPLKTESSDLTQIPIDVYEIPNRYDSLNDAGMRYALTGTGNRRFLSALREGRNLRVNVIKDENPVLRTILERVEQNPDVLGGYKATINKHGEDSPNTSDNRLVKNADNAPNQEPPKKKRHWIRNTLLGILGVYTLSYGIGTGAVFYDYNHGHKQWLAEHPQNTIITRDYTAETPTGKKHITLVGETHIYTKEESEYARQLLKGADAVFAEGYEIRDENIVDSVVHEIRYAVNKPPFYFFELGSGRGISNNSLLDMATEEGKPLIRLEENTKSYDDTNTKGRLNELRREITRFAVAPIGYPSGKFFHRTADNPPEIIEDDLFKRRNENMLEVLSETLPGVNGTNVIFLVGKNHIPDIERIAENYGLRKEQK